MRFIAGAALNIQNAVIRTSPPAAGRGSNSPRPPLRNYSFAIRWISRNGAAATRVGIVIEPTGGFSSVTLTRVTMDNNSNGLVVDTTTTAGGAFVQMLDSSASGNGNTGVALIGGVGGTQSFLAVDRSASVNNSTGVSSSGSNSNVLLSHSVVSGNTTGFSLINSGKIVSFSNNMFNGNSTKGAPSTITAAQ